MNSKRGFFFSVAIPAVISFFFMLPFIRRHYQFVAGEFDVYQSYLRIFLEMLSRGELPLWNEYIGNGHPAVYFGHYPIHTSALFYWPFHYSDFAYGLNKFLTLAIILISYIWAMRKWNVAYWESLVGAFVFFFINFTNRNMVPDTVINLTTFFCPLFLLLLAVVRDNFTSRKDLLGYFVLFYLWASGSPITYLIMPMACLGIAYLLTAWIYRTNRTRTAVFLPILLFLPWGAVAYQFYLVYDVIAASDRLRTGLVVSPLAWEPWLQFTRSLLSSSYIWITLLVAVHWFTGHYTKWKPALRWGAVVLLLTVLIIVHNTFKIVQPLGDLRTLALSPQYWLAASGFWLWIRFVSRPDQDRKGLVLPFLLLTLLLSYYFYLPGNIGGGGEPGYDYSLYQELGFTVCTLLNFFMFLSLKNVRKNPLAQISLWSLVILYLIRSHFSILMLRWTGVVWYATRDGLIFSLLFALLVGQGFIIFLNDLRERMGETRWSSRSTRLVNALAVLIFGLFFFAAYDKMYRGPSHKFNFPLVERKVKTPHERSIYDAHLDFLKLREKIKEIDSQETGFYRIFSPNVTGGYLAGVFQDLHIHEAAIYESTVTKAAYQFYRQTLLGFPETKQEEFKNLLPYAQFAKHFHRGIGLENTEIPYVGFYLHSAQESPNLPNQNVELLWDLAQVKYLLVNGDFAQYLEKFSTKNDYELLGQYPKADTNLYRITKVKSYSRFAFLKRESGETTEDLLAQLNSPDVETLKKMRNRLKFLNDVQWRTVANHKLEASLDLPDAGLFINFESWNKNWKFSLNGAPAPLYRAFHIFRAFEVSSGTNPIALSYELPYLRFFLGLAMLVPVIFMALVWGLTRRRKA